ncbi:MAG TPA: hypothetical protein PLD23_13355 [Armatimonadota bacterium]|nr:hypothetical protein [Armatimonadota bacterium]
MKDQYFGDRRDFWKYDLLMELAERAVGHPRLTILPMLTRDDGSAEGKLTSYPVGGRRSELREFLWGGVKDGRRSLPRLHCFFDPIGWDLALHDHEWLPGERSGDYFASLPTRLAADAVVFIDPDIGLVPEKRAPSAGNRPKYVSYDQAGGVFRLLRGTSVLVIYQHLQFNAHKRESDLQAKCRRLSQELSGRRVWGLWAGDLAFVVCACPTADDGVVGQALEEYASRLKMRLLCEAGSLSTP